MTVAQRRRWVAVALSAAVALAGWRIFGASMPAESAGAVGDAWNLPGRGELAGDKLLEALLAVDPWGLGRSVYERPKTGAAPGEPTATAPSRWSFKGMVQEGSNRFVLVSIDGKPAEPLGVGQSLPSGEKILQVEPDRLCILIKGQRRSLEIRTR